MNFFKKASLFWVIVTILILPGWGDTRPTFKYLIDVPDEFSGVSGGDDRQRNDG